MKRIRHFITLLALACIIVGQTLTSYAANTASLGSNSGTESSVTYSTVTYDCNAHVFILEPGSDKAPTDLFTNFKDVIPGQTLTQEIVIRNDEKSDMISKVYLRSLGANEQSKEFLSQLKLQVSVADGGTANKELSIGTADEPQKLSDWVCLGELEPGASVKLLLTLEVPISLDNKFQEAVGSIQWEFRSEELPIPEDEAPEDLPEPAEPDQMGAAPTTGDETYIGFYLLMLLLGAVAFGGIWGACGHLTEQKRFEITREKVDTYE